MTGTGDEIYGDFFFIGVEGQPGGIIPKVAVRAKRSRMLVASVVLRKTTWTFVSRPILVFRNAMGYQLETSIMMCD